MARGEEGGLAARGRGEEGVLVARGRGEEGVLVARGEEGDLGEGNSSVAWLQPRDTCGIHTEYCTLSTVY